MSTQRPHKFFDVFEYERVEQDQQTRVFYNCRLLKPMIDKHTHLPTGHVIHSLSMMINYYMWDAEEEMVEDIAVSL